MTAALWEELKQWLERLKREEALDPERYLNSGMLLRLPNGLAVEPVLIRKKFLKWQDAHPEFPRIVFHGLRHTHDVPCIRKQCLCMYKASCLARTCWAASQTL